MIPTKSRLSVGDRIEVSGEITRLSGPFYGTDRMSMTVLIPGTAALVILEAICARRDPETLQIGVFVQLRGRLASIDQSADKRRTMASVLLDGHPYEVTVPMRDVRKTPD